MRYTISEMAALLGVTTHTLRYYEKMGLIQPEVNRETGYRYYTVTDTRRFNLCRELRAAGFTLEECKDFLDEPSTAVTDAMLDRQIRQLERRQVLNRLSIRFLQKTAATLLRQAELAIAEAHRRHDELEQYYIEATNFAEVDRLAEGLLKKLAEDM